MSPFEKWLLWGSSLATFATGVVYAWMKYLMEPVNEWAAINHPWQPWALKAHIVAAPLLVFAVGVIATGHIWKHYRSGVRIGRRSGVTMMWILAPMIVSGYLIQAVTHAGWLEALIWIHVVTGLVYGLSVLWHHMVFRRRRRIRERLGGARWEAVGTVSLGREGGGEAPDGARDATGSEARVEREGNGPSSAEGGSRRSGGTGVATSEVPEGSSTP